MKLASIEVIRSIKRHPNADFLDIAEIQGWQVVVKRYDFTEGEKVVFIPIDSIVPYCQWSSFLSQEIGKPIRIKNVKLRGEHSSGLVVHLNYFPDFFKSLEVGTDLTSELDIKKYVKEIPAHLAGESVGDFPTYVISKTDEINGLSDISLVDEVLEHSKYLTITQKIDGSSITIIIRNGEIVEVCSRNLSKKETPDSTFWTAARKLNIPPNWSGVIQGELAGNGIQSNPLKIEGIKIFVFQILIEGKYLTYEEMSDFCKNNLNCDVVPLVVNLEVESTVNLWINPLQKLQELADKQTYECGDFAEGIVVRPSDYPRFTASRRPLGFKLINRNYNDT